MKKEISYCALPDKRKTKEKCRTRFYRHKGGCSWAGVPVARYKKDDGTWAGVLRKTLVGIKGEKTKFELRYFEVAPGGTTSFEHHRHEHVVVCVKGAGKCRAGKRTYDMGFLDTVYIAPDEIHALANPYKEPFGFFCIVDAKRDRPKPVKR